MTVKAPQNREDYIVGPGTQYAYGWRIFNEQQLSVFVKDGDNDERELKFNTEYTVSNVGRRDGGSITLTGTLPSDGSALTILPNFAFEQVTDFRNQGRFLAETHEDEFDRQTMLSKQLDEQSARSLQIPRTIPPSAFNSFIPVQPGDQTERFLMAGSTGFKLDEVPQVFVEYAGYASDEADRAEAAASSLQEYIDTRILHYISDDQEGVLVGVGENVFVSETSDTVILELSVAGA